MAIGVECPVLTKSQNYRLWQGGAYGNKLRAWRSVAEWKASGFSGMVVLRILMSQGGGPCRYNLRPDEVEPIVAEWIAQGITQDQIMVNEGASDLSVLVQGEYLNSVYSGFGHACWGYFIYSRVKAQMRDALKAASAVIHGLQTDHLLKSTMTPSSYSDWLLLLQQYPNHALEVSIYEKCLGDIPGRNALVWEVRKY
jgi:hypothetical protein